MFKLCRDTRIKDTYTNRIRRAEHIHKDTQGRTHTQGYTGYVGQDTYTGYVGQDTYTRYVGHGDMWET